MKKANKILKTISIILAILLVIEIIFLGTRLYQNRKNTTFYTVTETTIKDGDNYISVGMSDFKHSKLNEYKEPGYNKPFIQVYDKDKNLLKETFLDLGFNGSYNDIVKVEDGYIVVGQLTMDSKQHQENLTEGVIVKYDFDLNIVWRQNLQILDTTKLYKVAIDNQDILVVGQSIYGANYIGNHKTGGAIFLKYNKDGKELKRANIGGPSSGVFNDIVVNKDSYTVVGIMNTSTGIIVNYNKNLKENWHNYYGSTDAQGLTSISKQNNDYIVTSSYLKDKSNTDTYEAAIIRFDSKGKLLNEQKWQKQDISRFENALVLDDKIIVLALYGVKEDNVLHNQSAILELDNDFNITKEEYLEGKNTVTFKNIIQDNDTYLVTGYTNSKLKEITSNGYDYYPLLLNYTKDLKR